MAMSNYNKWRNFTAIYGKALNSGEHIPRRLCRGVSEQRNREVLDGIGFPTALRRGVLIVIRILFLQIPGPLPIRLVRKGWPLFIFV